MYEREDGEGSLIDMMESEHETNPEELLVSQEHAKSLEERLEKDLSQLERRVLYLHLIGAKSVQDNSKASGTESEDD